MLKRRRRTGPTEALRRQPCMYAENIYLLFTGVEKQKESQQLERNANEAPRVSSSELSDQSAVLSDISVTPQRIMTVGAAPACVVLKRFISSHGLRSASMQVLNNSFIFFFFLDLRIVSEEADTQVRHGSCSRVSHCVFHDASRRFVPRQPAPVCLFYMSPLLRNQA